MRKRPEIISANCHPILPPVRINYTRSRQTHALDELRISNKPNCCFVLTATAPVQPKSKNC
jgi:hypothetical protein